MIWFLLSKLRVARGHSCSYRYKIVQTCNILLDHLRWFHSKGLETSLESVSVVKVGNYHRLTGSQAMCWVRLGRAWLLSRYFFVSAALIMQQWCLCKIYKKPGSCSIHATEFFNMSKKHLGQSYETGDQILHSAWTQYWSAIELNLHIFSHH